MYLFSMGSLTEAYEYRWVIGLRCGIVCGVVVMVVHVLVDILMDDGLYSVVI